MQILILDPARSSLDAPEAVIGIIGSAHPTPAEKLQSVEALTHYAADGWAIAGDPTTPIGQLAAAVARTAAARFLPADEQTIRTSQARVHDRPPMLPE